MENYKEKVAGFTDEQLNNYIENRYKYIPEIVHAAIQELQKRGRIFSDEELKLIYADIEIKPGDEKVQEVEPVTINYADAPEYYTTRLIRVFSVLFSVLFGSIMMAMNLSRTPGKKGVMEVIIFGVIYTTTLIIIGSYLPNNSGGLGIILNLAGGYMLEYFFWNKYIGAETLYKKRSFVVPLIIGIAITAVLIAIFYSGL